jgi:hypothetical protein
MIEYFRLNIEYLRSASGESILIRSIKKMTERHAAQAPAPPDWKPTGWKRCASDFHKYSIFNIQ